MSTSTPTNYWTDQALALDYHAGSRTQAALIIRENDGRGILTCGQCGGDAHYKHTIGTHKCTRCDALLLGGTWE